MPFTQPKTWKTIQMKLHSLINTRQLPEAKKTCGDYTKIKLLHNLYTQGKLFVDKGLVMVKNNTGYFKGSLYISSSKIQGKISDHYLNRVVFLMKWSDVLPD